MQSWLYFLLRHVWYLVLAGALVARFVSGRIVYEFDETIELAIWSEVLESHELPARCADVNTLAFDERLD